MPTGLTRFFLRADAVDDKTAEGMFATPTVEL